MNQSFCLRKEAETTEKKRKKKRPKTTTGTKREEDRKATITVAEKVKAWRGGGQVKLVERRVGGLWVVWPGRFLAEKPNDWGGRGVQSIISQSKRGRGETAWKDKGRGGDGGRCRVATSVEK